jgi:hypothetical protein
MGNAIILVRVKIAFSKWSVGDEILLSRTQYKILKNLVEIIRIQPKAVYK